MMKSAAYMSWILLFKNCKFSDKICYNYGDNKFFLRDCSFIGAPCIYQSAAYHTYKCFYV